MTVLVTGADGRIGSVLMQRLPAVGWELVAFDGDVRDGAAVHAAAVGCEAVVHLAGIATEAPWDVIRDVNIDGTVNVFEAARRNSVRRVVYASSTHAVGFERVAPNLAADLRPRPDTLYGVSKVFGEALGRYYVDRYGMSVTCLRIGTFEDRPRDHRTLATWLSPDDCVRLVDAALRADGFAIVAGVSANAGRYWSAESGRAIGFVPRDDASAFADEVQGEPHESDAFVGGGFTSDGFGIDEVAARWV